MHTFHRTKILQLYLQMFLTTFNWKVYMHIANGWHNLCCKHFIVFPMAVPWLHNTNCWINMLSSIKRPWRNTRPCLWKWQLILQMSQRFLPTFNYVMWRFLWFLIAWFFYLKWCIHLSSLDRYMMCFYVILLHHWKYVKESYALYSNLTNYFMSSQFFHSIFLLRLEALIYKVQPKYMILLSIIDIKELVKYDLGWYHLWLDLLSSTLLV